MQLSYSVQDMSRYIPHMYRNMKILGLSGVMLYPLLNMYRHLDGSYCLYFSFKQYNFLEILAE